MSRLYFKIKQSSLNPTYTGTARNLEIESAFYLQGTTTFTKVDVNVADITVAVTYSKVANPSDIVAATDVGRYKYFINATYTANGTTYRGFSSNYADATIPIALPTYNTIANTQYGAEREIESAKLFIVQSGRLYFTISAYEPVFTGEELNLSIDSAFYLVDEGLAKPTKMPVNLQNVTRTIVYTTTLNTKPSVVPINVGRYDYRITATVSQGAMTLKGFSTSDYYAQIPSDLHPYDSVANSEYGAAKEKDPTKPFIITPMPVTIEFTTTQRVYTGFPEWPTYKVKSQTNSKYLENIQLRLTYSYSGTPWWQEGDYANTVSGSGTTTAVSSTEAMTAAIPPVNVGNYEMEAVVIDANYKGSSTIIYKITERTAETVNESGYTDEEEYEQKLSLLSDETKTDMTSKQFLTSATMKILDNVDVINLDKITSLADCAKNLPQKLLNAATKKIIQLALNYIPGLGIIQLLTSALKLIQQVQEILKLVEEIRKNPLTFLDAVLEGTGAYEKIGDAIDGTVNKLSKEFPAVGNALTVANNAVNGLVDFCETENFDVLGNIIPKSTKADSLKTPEDVKGFTPAVSRQPVEQKVNYDAFLFEIKQITAKDNDKIKSLSLLADKTKLNEYLAMLTTLNELAYSYHDSIAKKATAKGLVDASVVSFNTSSDGSSKLDSIISGLGGTLDTANSIVSLGGGATTSSVSAVNTANSALGSVASSIDGVTNSIGSVGTLLSGGSTLSEFMNSFNSGLAQAANSVDITGETSEFNALVAKALARNPKWSSETVSEFKTKVKIIKAVISNYKNDILNNPLFAKATETNATADGTTTNSSGSSESSTSSSGSASLASLKNETEKTQFNRMRNLILASTLNGYKPSDGDKYGITSGSADEWALFFTKLGVKESGLRNGVVGDVGKFAGNSNGLYQLSPLDYATYATHMRAAGIDNGTTLNGKPAFSMSQLQDPDINSKAALVIAERLIQSSGAIGSNATTGMAKYWGPLRRGWTPSNMA